MSRKSDRRSTALTVLPPTGYEVGYRKPPVHSQFQKGSSGNPKGRPKGAKAKTYPAHAERLKAIVLEEAYRMIGVRDGLREIKVPMAQAIVRALAVNAVKGQQRAQLWRGRSWASLSSVAREITGTRRNGPAFFGLRDGEAS